MNNNVTDIFQALKNLEGKISSLEKTVDDQQECICNLTRINDRLRKENRILKNRLAKYESPDKDSNNSSVPPSKERMSDEVKRRTKTLRKATGRKPGGQFGHDGNTLLKSEFPDSIIDISANYCTQCGHSLEDCERILDYVTQVITLPELKPVIKEIRHYKTICNKCGATVQSHKPRKRGGNAVIYDASVKSLAVYLSVVQFLPYGRIENIFHEIFGIELTQGSLVNWINDAKAKALPAIEKIKECIMQSAVVGFDESGCYCNKRLDWAWIAQTVYFTLLFRGNGRSSKELTDRFGDSLERMIAVTDRHSAYFALHFLNHQVCFVHILRELQYLNEVDDKQQWSRRIENILQQAIHERNEHPQDIILKDPWLKRLDDTLKQSVTSLGKDFQRLKNGLIKCRDYMFNFLEDPLIPSDNNDSERGIRKLKIKLKNSGTFRSELGADAFLELHSIVETAKKHDLSPYKAIRALWGSTDSYAMAFAE